MMATPRPPGDTYRFFNRQYDLLEPILSYTKQTIAPRSNRELWTVLVFALLRPVLLVPRSAAPTVHSNMSALFNSEGSLT